MDWSPVCPRPGAPDSGGGEGIMSPRRDPSRLLHIAALVALAVAVLAPEARAQALGDVARDAQATRKALDRPGKVYTNDSLRPDRSPVRAPAPAPPGVQEGPTAAGEADEVEEGSPARDEAYWRGRVEEARSALSRAETFASALESQVNGLYAEYAGCAGQPRCNEIAARRQKSLAELDRVKHEITTCTTEIASIQEEARRAGVPAGWVR